MNWIRYSLNRQLLFSLSTGLIFSSLLCLMLFTGLYHAQLAEERSSASVAVNRLLQVSLENAMLKQDLDGLREIVQRLGQQEDIHQVFIVNPRGEVRFASQKKLLGQIIEWQHLPHQAQTLFLAENGNEVLRSINPVHNQKACIGCHGILEDNPINGVLFVDYAAAPIRAKARENTLLFIGAGIFIISLTLLMLWFFVRHLVLQPVQRLACAGEALANNDLSARVSVPSHNELGRLANTFNHMAASLQSKIRELNEQELFLQALLDAIPDGIRVLDHNYQVLKVNHAYCQQLNLDYQTALAQPCYNVYQRRHPCVPTLSTCPLHEIKQAPKPIKKLTHYLSADGQPHPVEVFAAPMTVEIEGASVQLIVESIRDLKQAVHFSHEQKLAVMGQVAAGVAHEIHNPLASLRLALQNTLRLLDTGDCDPPALKNYLNLVDKEMDKCIAVTQRLLKLTTLGGGQLQAIDMATALQEVLSLLAYESQERKVQIDTQIETTDSRVLAQENDLRMIIINLVQNAFHAMPDGGKLSIHLEQQAEQLQLHFQDTGTGIIPEHFSQIFDPFFSYRADGKKGTGLGLSICKTLAEQYQGKIQVRSHQGEGACFSLQLPAAQHALQQGYAHEAK
jgi:signal transduction histidine kinase/HAMP domain-containing protein